MHAKAISLLAALTLCFAACSDDETGSGGAGGSTTSTASGPSTTTSSSSTAGPGSTTSTSSSPSSSSSGSGGGGGGDELCNGVQCHADQTCEPSGCTFACAGATVPGDYATLEAAVLALSGTPGAVICLAAQDYAEPGFVIHGDDITIIGPSASQTTISLTPSGTVRKNVKLRGVTFTTPLNATGSFNVSSNLEATAVRFEQGIKLDRGGSGAGTTNVTVALDQCDVRGGIFALDGTTGLDGDYFITATNSYIHDSPDDSCVRAHLSQSSADLIVNLSNNTIVGCESGIDMYVYSVAGSNDVTLNLYNNIVANHSMFGISIEASGDEMVDTANNALFGNATNYAGVAVDGPGYVKMDCLLDGSSSPPGLSAGSPCRDAAAPAHAPAIDYWGVARSATPDIGAVEVP